MKVGQTVPANVAFETEMESRKAAAAARVRSAEETLVQAEADYARAAATIEPQRLARDAAASALAAARLGADLAYPPRRLSDGERDALNALSRDIGVAIDGQRAASKPGERIIARIEELTAAARDLHARVAFLPDVVGEVAVIRGRLSLPGSAALLTA